MPDPMSWTLLLEATRSTVCYPLDDASLEIVRSLANNANRRFPSPLFDSAFKSRCYEQQFRFEFRNSEAIGGRGGTGVGSWAAARLWVQRIGMMGYGVSVWCLGV